MISWWPGNGNANDIIGLNHGTLVNGATFAPGMSGLGFSFDGVDDFVNIPDTPDLDLTIAITIEGWVKPASFRALTVAVAQKRLLTNNTGYGLFVHSTILQGTVFGEFDHLAHIPNPIPTDVFTHVAWTYDKNESVSKLYMNGTLVSTDFIMASIWTNDAPLQVGRVETFCCGVLFAHGVIDEVKIYNRALSATEIQDIFLARGLTEDCANGIDDDEDGLVDCADPECCDDPICVGIPPCTVLTETIQSQQAVINNAEVTGDFTSTLNFTSLEFVTITTGPFAGKGFSKGTCETTLEGVPYTGEWRGVTFLKPQERKIYLKGAVTGQINATVEGSLTESVPDSGIYDQYQATWKIGRLGSTAVSATINLNGNVSYQSSSVFNGTALRLLQDNIETTDLGQYGGAVNTVITHLRVVSYDNPYAGEGFSIISYTSTSGSGQGWTYDRLLFPGMVEMKGLFSSPLYGIASATLDDSTLPRTLSLRIERIDLGKPPAPDLKVVTWGPDRVSPGQTINYIIEVRNDGTKPAENVTVIDELPWQVGYVSNTGEGVYKEALRRVDWNVNLPARSKTNLTTKTQIIGGLGGHTFFENRVRIPKEEPQLEPEFDPTIKVSHDVQEISANQIRATTDISSIEDNGIIDTVVTVGEALQATEPVFDTIQREINGIKWAESIIKFAQPKGEKWEQVQVELKAKRGILEIVGKAKEFADLTTDSAGYFQGSLHRQKDLNQLLEEGKIDFQTYDNFTDKNMAVLVGSFIPAIVKQFPGSAPFSTAVEGLPGFLPWLYQKRLERDLPVYEALKALREQQSLSVSSHTNEVITARDPNIKYGPSGAVVAGQMLNYRVEFENEGEGIAFGVYFTDTLDEDLDDSTLVIGEVKDVKTDAIIGEPRTYDPNTRTITWFVGNGGEVGSKEGGYADISVNVRGDAPRGTEIINYGTVYFPSVPEETRTNAIVSIIPIEICDNGIDDDGDELIDCDDPDCSGQACPEVCDDGIDNDGDGFVDCADTDCPPCPEICDDGLDNDRDGLVDSDDPDCMIDKTPPTVTVDRSPAPNSFGWNNTPVQVTFTATDDLSGIAGVPIEIVSLSLQGANQGVSRTFTDVAGNSTTASASGINIDFTPPTITVSRTPAPNPNGWNNTDVQAHFAAGDNLSGIVGDSFFDVFFTVEGANQGASWSATDRAGNSASATVSEINIDKTPPSITGAPTTPPNANNWYNGCVTVGFNCSDNLSGVDNCSPDTSLCNEGENQCAMGTACDMAGNCATTDVCGINIDTTPPVTHITLSGMLRPGATCYGSDVDVSLSATDNLSGVESTLYNLDGAGWVNYAGMFTVTSNGLHSVMYKSIDMAGNVEAEQSVGFTIDKTPPEAVIRFDTVSRDIKVFNSEDGGVSYVVLPSNEDDDNGEDEHGWELRQYTLTDCAMNSLVLVLEHKKEGNEAKVNVLSMQYNGGAIIEVAKNKMQAEYAVGKNGALRELNQKIKVKDLFEARAKYSAQKDVTEIKVKLEGQDEQKETRAGLVILELLTDTGVLGFRY